VIDWWPAGRGRSHVANDFSHHGHGGAAPPGDQVRQYFFVAAAVDMPTLGVDTGHQRGGQRST
jgi:phosphatidylethanolamine-binding protein (PEBP) family uncharacterized protein